MNKKWLCKMLGCDSSLIVKKDNPTEVEDDTTEDINVDSSGKRICLVVGHNAGAKGAVNYLNESEWDFNKRIAEMLQTELIKKGYHCNILFRPVGVSYNSQCKSVARQAKEINSDITICMHFNSYNSKVQGCEVLILDTKSDLDNLVADKITDCLNEVYAFNERHDDGVFVISSSHAGYGMLNELRKVGACAVLIEPMFADNKNSSVIFEDEQKYVQTLLNSITSIKYPSK